MERMILATGQLSDAATITGPTGAGDLGIANLKTQSLQKPYRVTSNTITLDIDLGSAKAINTFAIMGHSGSSDAYAQVTAGATPGAATLDTGLVPFRSHQTTYGGDQSAANVTAFDKNLFFQFFNPAQTYRYWRIVINDPAASYIDLGRLYIANSFQPSYNMAYGFQLGFIDPSEQYETTGGDLISRKLKKRRFIELTLQDLTESEVFSKIFPLDKYVGASGDVLFVPKPDDKTYLQFNAVYGKIEQLQPNAWNNYDQFSRQYRIKELLP